MITYIKINGFKSFHNFEMEFTPLTVVAGVNAAGKSNLFDALNLLSRLAETDHLKKAFKEQRGEFIELFTQYDEGNFATEMEFCAEMLTNRSVTDDWGNTAELKYTRLRYELKISRFKNTSGVEDLAVTYEHLEKLNHRDDKWLKLIPLKTIQSWRPKIPKGKGPRGIPYIQTVEENGIPTVWVPQDGNAGIKRRFPLTNASRTVLSSFDAVDFPHVLAAKNEMESWRFLQLNPEALRLPTNKSTGSENLSPNGENLAGVLQRIKISDEDSLIEISRRLQTFLPQFTDVDVFDEKANNQFIIKLKDNNIKTYSSRVLSEGTLRFLALCILEHDDDYNGLLCFEEPENGINPFHIKDIASLLKDLSVDLTEEEGPLRQVIINTHSPVLVGNLNKWEEDPNVSIWYARMMNRVADINDKRLKMSVTSILPVAKKNQSQLGLNLSEQEKKLTLSSVKKYLETATDLI